MKGLPWALRRKQCLSHKDCQDPCLPINKTDITFHICPCILKTFQSYTNMDLILKCYMHSHVCTSITKYYSGLLLHELLMDFKLELYLINMLFMESIQFKIYKDNFKANFQSMKSIKGLKVLNTHVEIEYFFNYWVNHNVSSEFHMGASLNLNTPRFYTFFLNWRVLTNWEFAQFLISANPYFTNKH